MAAPSYRPTTRRLFGYATLALFAVVFLGPFFIQIATSFKTDNDATNNTLSLVPHPAVLNAWKTLFGVQSDISVPFIRWLTNSIFVTICITIGRVALDTMAGYALARIRFPGRRLIYGLILTTLAVPGVVLLIPRFLVLKQLGMFNSYQGMILPIAADGTGIFLMRGFFMQVPVALEEAAEIDGAGVFRTFFSVILPLVRPGLITLTILSFQGSWNEFAFFQVATVDPKYRTLTTGLAYLTSGGISAGNLFPIKLGAALMTTIPVAILFFVFQKRLVRGQMAGAVKG